MSSMIHIRLDDELKSKGNEALEAMGLSASEAVRLLYHRIVSDQAFPLELKVPSKTTQLAMDEADEILAAKKARFTSADELISAIED